VGDCEGVMVTTTGYQKGAKAVADTYGIVITELRAPTDDDLQGRAVEVHLDIGRVRLFWRDVGEALELSLAAGVGSSAAACWELVASR